MQIEQSSLINKRLIKKICPRLHDDDPGCLKFIQTRANLLDLIKPAEGLGLTLSRVNDL